MVKGKHSIRLTLIIATRQFGWILSCPFQYTCTWNYDIPVMHSNLAIYSLQSLLDSHCYFWSDFFMTSYLFIVGSWHDISLWRWRLYGRGHCSHGSLPTQAGTLIDAGKTAMQKNKSKVTSLPCRWMPGRTMWTLLHVVPLGTSRFVLTTSSTYCQLFLCLNCPKVHTMENFFSLIVIPCNFISNPK